MNKIPESEISCYHGMIKYLAELENTTTTKNVELKEFPKSIKKGGKRYLGIVLVKNGIEYNYIETKTIKGGVKVRLCSDNRHLYTKWDNNFYTKLYYKQISYIIG